MKIIHGDCIEELGKLGDESIDLLLTDPPYGDNMAYGYAKKRTIVNNDVPPGCACTRRAHGAICLRKLLAYRELIAQGAPKKHFGIPNLLILNVTVSERHWRR